MTSTAAPFDIPNLTGPPVLFDFEADGTLRVGAGLTERQLTEHFSGGQRELTSTVILFLLQHVVMKMVIFIGPSVKQLPNAILACYALFTSLTEVEIWVDSSMWAFGLTKMFPVADLFRGLTNRTSNALLTLKTTVFEHQISIAGIRGTLTNTVLFRLMFALVDLNVGPTTTNVAFARATGAFANIQNLQISGNLSSVRDIVNAFAVNIPGAPILSLECRVPSLQSYNEARAFFCSLGSTTPLLQKLCVVVDALSLNEDGIYWMRAIVHLAQCHHLVQVKIEHPLPLPLNDADVGYLLASWPAAQIISLNPKPELGFGVDLPYFCPSLGVLDVVAARGGQWLYSFGIFLSVERANPGPFRYLAPRRLVSELEIGSSTGLSVAARKMTRKLFPNAQLI